MNIARIMKQRITIKSAVIVGNAGGGETRTFSVKNGPSGSPLLSLPASIQTRLGGGAASDGSGSRAIWVQPTIYTATDVSNVGLGDRVEDAAGKIYPVRSVSDEGGQGRVWKILCDQELPV